MSFISYAQNFEDVMLWRALKHIEQGFYIDVGAAWPDKDSVTKTFYDHGWRGINIEPNFQHYHALELQRPEDKNLQLAVGERTGQLEMSMFSGTGLSTLDAEIGLSHREHGFDREAVQVSIVTLTEIFDSYIPPEKDVHFLKVDVEGLEKAVLLGNNWSIYRPWIVVVEATLPMTQIESHDKWEPILLSADYIFAYADGLNRFYVAKEHENLLTAFKYPPNVFDGFKLSGWKIVEEQLEKAYSRIAQLEAKVEQTEVRTNQIEIQANQAEIQANQAEIRANQAEIRANQAELKSIDTEQRELHLIMKLDAIYTSRSWRATKPLRFCGEILRRFFSARRDRRIKSGIKRRILSSLRSIGFIAMRYDFIRTLLTRILNRYPKIKDKLRGVLFVQSMSSSYMMSANSAVPIVRGQTLNSRAAEEIYRDLMQAIEGQDK